eukprot:TRINITY_DN2178_c0_g1_i1.p1 TRINITY_DN2178_c0_g1~~TRINITY_DN2178_c0_g1_i1.p1  ORF type:complete len:385 (+),score=87.84 TRINITY_DN2178_c0_g1_i1:122-1156(+)
MSTLQGQIGGIDCTALQGNTIAAGSNSGTIALFDLETMRLTAKFSGAHSFPITKLLFSGSDTLISASVDKTIKVWDVPTGKQKCVLAGHSGPVLCMDLSGNTLVSGSSDNSVRVWDVRAGNTVAELRGHNDAIRCLQLGPRSSKDAALVVLSGSDDKALKMWDLRKNQFTCIMNEHTQPVRCAFFDTSKVYSGSLDKTIKVWDRAGKCRKTLVGHEGAVSCLAVSDVVAAASPAAGGAAGNGGGARLVSGGGDNTVRMWDPHTGQCTAVLKAHEGPIVALAVLEDWIVSASSDKTVCIWANGKCLKTLHGHEGNITALHVPLKRRVITASLDTSIRLWALEPST